MEDESTSDKYKQQPLMPEVAESISHFKKMGYGVKSEGEQFSVPGISMDQETRRLLSTWPIEISSRQILILEPFAFFAELEPCTLIDFKDSQNIQKVEFKLESATKVIMVLYFKDGEVKQSSLVLEENGKISHKLSV